MAGIDIDVECFAWFLCIVNHSNINTIRNGLEILVTKKRELKKTWLGKYIKMNNITFLMYRDVVSNAKAFSLKLWPRIIKIKNGSGGKNFKYEKCF